MGLHSQRVTHPLAQATVADLAAYPWPDPYRPDRVTGLHQQARKLYEETGYALVAAPVSGGLFEFAVPRSAPDLVHVGQHLRGMSNFLMDLLSDKAFASGLLDRILAVHMGLWEVFLKGVGEYVEMVQLADDFGTQRSLLISPRVFREMFKPRYAELIRHIRRFTGAKVFLHCDGAITPLIEDFIEIGVQVLNPLQPTAAGMDPAAIKARFGDRLAFHGAIDNQQLLPNGTPELLGRNRYPAQPAQRHAGGGHGCSAPRHWGTRSRRRVHPGSRPRDRTRHPDSERARHVRYRTRIWGISSAGRAVIQPTSAWTGAGVCPAAGRGRRSPKRQDVARVA